MAYSIKTYRKLTLNICCYSKFSVSVNKLSLDNIFDSKNMKIQVIY